MRSVISAAMTSALHDLGYANVFDDIYGSSAGALIGAYFVAGQAPMTPAIYYEDLCTRKFVNRARVLSRQPAMSLDFLFDVVDNVKPLDWNAAARSPMRIHPLATSVDAQAVVDLGPCRAEQQLRAALRASSVLPVFGGPPYTIEGIGYLDAGLLESLPFATATKDGCTHILVLRTRPFGVAAGRASSLERFIARRVVRAPAALLNLIEERPSRYHMEDQELGRKVASVDAEPAVFAIAPNPDEIVLERITLNRALVKNAAAIGIKAVWLTLQGETPIVYERLSATPHSPSPDRRGSRDVAAWRGGRG